MNEEKETEENIIEILAPEIKEIEKKSAEELEKERLRMVEKKKVDESLDRWVPKTKIGKLVKEKKIKDIDEILEKYKILEPEIVDSLLNLKSDLLAIGQAKGKFGGGKRRVWRQTQKKTAEGNVIKFSCLAAVGDGNGHVGIGLGKASETLPAKEKAIREAKLNLIRIKRGCGSFDCSCEEKHSIPLKVKGKVSSSVIVLIPAAKGTGLVIDDECKKIMRLAGIRDIYSRTFGQTRSKINLAQACIHALEEINKIKEK